jgi:type 1 fimbriae regulatory protein FimB
MNKQEPLTQNQLKNLQSAASTMGPREACMITLASHHAMRASEIAGMKVSSINLKDGTMFVARLKNSISKTESFQANDRAVIEAWLAVKPKSEFLFPGRDASKAISRVQIYRLFVALAGMAGIPDVSRASHALRHTIGQTLADNGATMQLIMGVMGHRSANSSASYFRLKQSTIDSEKARLLGLSNAA